VTLPQGARKGAAAQNVVSLNPRTKAGQGQTFSAQTGGTGDGGDTWRESVESRLGELRTDVRHLLIGGGVVALALLGAGWGVYTAAMDQVRILSVQQENISGKIDTLDARMGGKMDAINQRLDDQSNERRGGK